MRGADEKRDPRTDPRVNDRFRLEDGTELRVQI
jgi:hypothetical protein